ncbi:hypothetical protein JXL83_03155 [candidate division WOR-3 bacterium]|nr:hypothetical protein [candidate division WOR-3 bacterium]
MNFLLLIALTSLTVNQLPVGGPGTYSIKDEPLYFSFEAQRSGYLSVVVKASDDNTDLTLTGRGPNTYFLDMSPAVVDIDAGGNTGTEQAVFTIQSPGTYYLIVNPYSALTEEKNFEVLAWFYETGELIETSGMITVAERNINDMENLSGNLNLSEPIQIFIPQNYDASSNLIYVRAEASEDIMLELYSPENPLSYILQSDYDLEGNLGIEELLYYSGKEKPLIVVRPYQITDTTEIFFNVYFETVPEDDKLTLSSNKAVDESFIDPDNNALSYVYSVSIPEDGLSEVNLSSDDADLVLMAFSDDTMYYSDNDFDGNTGHEKLILPGGKYYIVVTNNPNSRQYSDFTIEVLHHQDRDASRTNATTLKLGVRSNGDLSYGNFDFQDYFVFTADQKATYTFEVQGLTGEGDLIMAVEASDGESLLYSDIDNNGDPTNEICTIELDRGQKVYVKIYPYSDYDGVFTDCGYFLIVTME